MNSLDKAIRNLADAGVDLDPNLIFSLRTGQRHPERLSRTLDYLSRPRWLREIQESPILAQEAKFAIGRVSEGLAWCRTPDDENALCLLARRYMQMQYVCLREGTTISELGLRMREGLRLPSETGNPGSRFVRLRKSTVERFFRTLANFRAGRPLYSTGKSSHEGAPYVFERFEDGKKARPFGNILRWSCLDVLRPVALGILREEPRRQRYSKIKLSRLREYWAVARLCVYYTINYRDSLDLTVGFPGDDDRDGPGFIDLEGRRFIRFLGTDYFPHGDCFTRSRLPLPLLDDVYDALIQAGVRSDGTALGTQFGPRWHEGFHDWLLSKSRGELAGMHFRTTALETTFDAAALLHVGMAASELSLLRGHPVYGAGTECWYISTTTRELIAHWTSTVNCLRSWAGLTPVEYRSAGKEDVQHGTPCPSLQGLVADLRGRIPRIETLDEAAPCLIDLLNVLGLREESDVINPCKALRTFPAEMLQFVDKWQGDRPVGVRYLPLIPPVRALVELCARHFGERDFFSRAGRPRFAVGSAALRPFRTALYNALLRLGVESVVRQAVLGHDTSANWESSFVPIPNSRLLEKVGDALQVVLSECGYATAVAELQAVLDRIESPNLEGTRVKKVPDGRLKEVIDCDPKEFTPFRPLTSLESFLGAKVMIGIRDGLLPQTTTATAMCLSMELGIPFHAIAADPVYFTFRCVVCDAACQRYFFLVPILTKDLGGLEFYPMEFPAGSRALAGIQKELARLQKTHPALSPSSLLNFQLFPSFQKMKAGIGRYMSKLCSNAGYYDRLEDRDAARLLNRLSSHLCRWWQPASVASALTGAISDAINQMSISRVLADQFGIRGLHYLDGSSYDDYPFQKRGRDVSFKLRATRLKTAKPFLKEYVAKAEGTTSVLRVASGMVEWVRAHRVTPGLGRFRDLACAFGDSSKARTRIAEVAFARCRRAGLLEPSEPETLPSESEIAAATRKIVTRSLDRRNRVSDAEIRLVSKEQTARRLQTIFEGGLRAAESVLMTPGRWKEGPGWRAFYVPYGKTEAARRVIFLCFTTDRFIAEVQFDWDNSPDAISAPTVKSSTQMIRRQIRKLNSGEQWHPHALRRYAAIEQIDRAVVGHRNGIHALATAIRSFGHAWGFTMLNRYGGTSLARYAEQPCMIAAEGDLLAIHGRFLTRAESRLSRPLRRQYSLDTANEAALLRAVRRLHRNTKYNINGDHRIVGIDFSVETNLAISELSNPTAVKLSLPAAPHLSTYWWTIEEAIRIAAKKNLVLVLDIPLRIQRAHSKRLQRFFSRYGDRARMIFA